MRMTIAMTITIMEKWHWDDDYHDYHDYHERLTLPCPTYFFHRWGRHIRPVLGRLLLAGQVYGQTLPPYFTLL